MIPALREPLSFRCAADPGRVLRATRLVLREALMRPWRGEIELAQPGGSAQPRLDALLGAEAEIALVRAPGASRVWRGIVTACERLPAGRAWRRWRAVVEHPLALRGLGADSRLWRDRDPAALAAELLGGGGPLRQRVRQELRQAPPVRSQLVQWRESDLACATRLLEHEGVMLVADGDGALLADHPAALPRLDLALPLIIPAIDEAATTDPSRRPAVRAWCRRLRAVAGGAAVRDWNWRSPQQPIERRAATAGDGLGADRREDGSHVRDGGEAARLAAIRAEELHCARETWEGLADHPGLAAGHVFRISAPDEPDADGEWLATAAEHRAEQGIGQDGPPPTCVCTFSAWPADRPWRPARTTPVPRVPGLIPAVVDGPPGAVYADVDEDGCYRVRPAFATDDAATMAVRLATPSAGDGHGMHLPLHPGTEVLVAHLDGDPDRPVIAAAVANPTHPPVVRAANRSQSVLRSKGGNALVLDDAVGRERWLAVARRDRRAEVGGDDDSRIRGNRGAVIGGSDSVAVQGDAAVSIGRASSETVAGAKAVTVGAAMQVSVGGALNETVAGLRSEQVGAAKVEVVAGARSAQVGGDESLAVAGDHAESAAGKRQLRARSLRLAAVDEIALTCGKASLVLRKDGSIVLKGAAITIDGSGKVVVKGSKVAGN